MKKILKRCEDWLNNNFMPGITKFTQTRYLKIIMNSFMSVSALSIAGALFMLILSLPLGEGYTAFLQSTGLYKALNMPIQITSGLISLYLVFAVGYQTAKSFNENSFATGLISLASFLLLTPNTTTATLTDAATEVSVTGVVSGVYSISNFGASGMFMAMIVGLISSRFFIMLSKRGFKIKMPASVPDNVSQMFESMVPGGITLLLFVVINQIVALTSFGSVSSLIFGVIQMPIMKIGVGPAGYIVWVCAGIWLWMFGIHGGMVAYAAFSTIFHTARFENVAAFSAGLPAPYPYWNLISWFVIGGTGCTFALSLLMLIRHKSSQTKILGRLTMPCAIFNINEPMIFGCPIIMNPYLALPFCFVPLINLGLTAIVMNLGLVAWPTGVSIGSYMPIILQPALVNGSWTGAVWQIVLIFLDMVLWLPFYKAFDDNAAKMELENVKLEMNN